MKRILLVMAAFAACAALFTAAVLFPSCNVTRVVTNEAHYFQRGDTSIVIQTKTIESYDAAKKGL